MKKWLGVIMLVAVAAAGVFYFSQSSGRQQIASLESIVPEEAVYYVYAYNLNKKIEDFTSSRFFQQISESAVYKKFIKPKIERLSAQVPFVKDLIEKDTAFAVFSLENAAFQAQEASQGRFLFLARVDRKKHAGIKKAVADFYLLFSSKGKSAYEKYKGITITSYTLPSVEMKIHYALVSDVALLCNDSGMLRACIDLAKSKSSAGSLLANADFQRAGAKIKKDPLIWGYNNTKRYYQEIMRAYTYQSLRSKDIKEKNSLEAFTRIKPMIDMMNTLVGQSMYLDYDDLKSGFIGKSYTFFKNAGGSSTLVNLLTQDKAIDTNTLKMVPKNSVAYYGIRQDVALLWRFLKEFCVSLQEIAVAQMKSDPRYGSQKDMVEHVTLEGAIAMLESFLGLSIEKDILPVLDDNLGIAFIGFEDISVGLSQSPLSGPQEKMILFPQVYGFCGLKDSRKMQGVMEALTQSLAKNINQSFGQMRQLQGRSNPYAKNLQGNEVVAPEEKEYLRLQHKEYNGVTIHMVDIADFPVDSLKFNYCIVDKYIVMSLSVPLTEKMIDTYANKLSALPSNYYFESAQSYLNGEYSGIMFFDVKRLFDSLKATKSFAMFSDRLRGERKGDFSAEDLDSLIEIGERVTAVTSTTRLLDSETIESSNYIEIEGL